MSNHKKLLEEAVDHLQYWVMHSKPGIYLLPRESIKWERARDFLDTIDMKMDEANAKEQQALIEVTDQQVIAMHDEYKKRFANIVPVSPAEFRKLANMLLCVSLVLEDEL